MGETTKIEWCHHTWSPWWGCVKVSAGCANCYADALSNRWGLKIWGQDADRRFFTDHHWNEPVKWNKAAAAAKVRRRVFPSMCDPFEERPDLDEPRERMFKLIDATPHLDWLLVTKRPEHIRSMWPGALYRRNVWLITSVENQAVADVRIPWLMTARNLVPVLGLSCEPLLGNINLKSLSFGDGNTADCLNHVATDIWNKSGNKTRNWGRIDWVIVGGESGPKARPMHPAWARWIRDQCQTSGCPFFFKQWGEFRPIDMPWEQDSPSRLANNETWLNLAGGSGFHGDQVWRVRRVGKKNAGRELDGRIWDQMPEVKP